MSARTPVGFFAKISLMRINKGGRNGHQQTFIKLHYSFLVPMTAMDWLPYCYAGMCVFEVSANKKNQNNCTKRYTKPEYEDKQKNEPFLHFWIGEYSSEKVDQVVRFGFFTW